MFRLVVLPCFDLCRSNSSHTIGQGLCVTAIRFHPGNLAIDAVFAHKPMSTRVSY